MRALRKLPVWVKIPVGIAGWVVGLVSILLTSGPNNEELSIFFFMAYLVIYPIAFYRLAVRDKVMQIRCPYCKYEGHGNFIAKGSFDVELVLWLALIVPGLVYSIWRISNRKCSCPRCDFQDVVKVAMVVPPDDDWIYSRCR